MNSRPKEGLHVTLLTKKGAEKFTRFVHSIPDDVGLGWTPYTVLISDHAGSYKAFYTVREFRSWLGPNFRVVQLGRSHPGGAWAVWSGRIQNVRPT